MKEVSGMNLDFLSVDDIMELYANVLNELNKRNIIRTFNSPVGDYAEWIIADKLNLKLESNSQKGFDAVDIQKGTRYQIKSRWERDNTKKRIFNVIRNYDENQFDYLILVIFDQKFKVKEAYKVPHDIIIKYIPYNKHQNGYVVSLSSSLINDANVKDIMYLFK